MVRVRYLALRRKEEARRKKKKRRGRGGVVDGVIERQVGKRRMSGEDVSFTTLAKVAWEEEAEEAEGAAGGEERSVSCEEDEIVWDSV